MNVPFLGAALACLLPLAAPAADDLTVNDFELDTFAPWTTTGTAFGPGPARGTLPNQMPVTGFLGKRLVNSYHGGDGSVGTLTSPAFEIQRDYLSFLVGGGKYPGDTCINLLHDGKIVRTATGPNDRPGGSEELDWHTWDVRPLRGKSVVIEIVDRRTGGWGHINVDHIVQTDRPKKSGPAVRTLAISERYLHLPVRTGAPMRRMKLLLDGKTVREFDIELADDPAFFTFIDLQAFRGKSLVIEVAKMPEESKVLEQLKLAAEVPNSKELYREPHRPQFHFTSRRGWLNDPNGLVFLDGEYHLFYQHNPYGWNWGNMHWGHAVSKDLLRWREQPIALYPVRHGDWCFSGSAVWDPVRGQLMAAFTSTGRGECLVESIDRGRTWKEAPFNPVVAHTGRDPKLLWHAPTKRWIMAVYDEHQGKQWIAFYSSPDWKKWTFESRIEGFFECPDLFELPIGREHQWVLYAADGRYVLGQFDGHQFTPAGPKRQVWHGHFYAAQTFENVPKERRIQIGWGNGITFPGMPFNQQMTIPVELTLRPTPEGTRLFAEPVTEVESLREKAVSFEALVMRGTAASLPNVAGELLDLSADIETRQAESVTLKVRGVPIVWNAKKGELTCRQHKAPLAAEYGRIRLRILVDRGSIELFANGGRVAMSCGGIIPAQERSIEYHAAGGEAVIRKIEVATLKSVWSD